MSIRGYKRVEKLIRKDIFVNAGMKDLLGFCEKVKPAKCWKPLYQLEYEKGFDQLTDWLTNLLTKQPPTKTINGLWFGLFNPVLKDGLPTCCLYLAGSKRFDLDEGDPDWAVSPEYWPKDRYSNSKVLTTIYRTMDVTEGEEGAFGEYTLCLGYASLVVAAWCRSALRSKLLGKAPFRGVTVGYDSGDGILIDVLKQPTAP